MSSVYEDDIIKKRLLIEGDSGNEDRIINKLTKNFVKWSNSILITGATSGDNILAITDDENTEYLYEQMIVSLSQVEFGLLRNHFIYDMNKMEQENFKVLYEKINNEIEKAEKKIIESKLELQEAKKVRKNRQEYDILAKQIENYPDRLEMQSTIRNLEDKVENMKKLDGEYNKKIDLRRKQFTVVLRSLSSLKCLIENDLKQNDMIGSQSGRLNDDTVGSEVSNAIMKKDNVDDIEESDMPVQKQREKHYSVIEVEMEEAV